jgi:hypothetical protein
MVKTRKAMVREGKLGKIRKVLVEYPSRLADTFQKEKETRKQLGERILKNLEKFCNDIGTHQAS